MPFHRSRKVMNMMINMKKGPLPLRTESKAKAPLSSLLKGSMTVEAALIMPLWLFFFGNILTVLNMMRVEGSVIGALYDAGCSASEYAYYVKNGVSDILGTAQDTEESGESENNIAKEAASLLVSETYVKNRVETCLTKDYLDQSGIVGGSSGISYLQSDLSLTDDNIDLVADYEMKLPFPMVGKESYWMQGRYYGHIWDGYGKKSETAEEDQDELVYIVPTGTVYHRDRACTYLKPHTSVVSASEIDKLRSSDGSKYYPCEICRPSKNGTVIITTDGNRYHSDAGCSALNRTVLTVPLKEVEGIRKPCSKCGGASS